MSLLQNILSTLPAKHMALIYSFCAGIHPHKVKRSDNCVYWQLRIKFHITVSVGSDHRTYLKRHKGKFLYRAVSSPQNRSMRFTSLTDQFTQTQSRLLWEAPNHMLQLMREGCSYTFPSLSIARYSFIQLSELEQRRVKKLAHVFNTAAQDSNPGSRSGEYEALPLSQCALGT